MEKTAPIISKEQYDNIFSEIKKYEQKLSDIQKGKAEAADVGVFPGITATVKLELTKGNKPTRWFGLSRGAEYSSRIPGKSKPLPTNPETMDPYSSQTVPPPYIRVAIRANGSDGKPDPKGVIIRTDTVDFDFYVKHVLPQEWIPSWHKESLKAGAMAVKEYAWYWVNKGGKYPSNSADVDNSVNSQVYNPNISYSSTDTAVDNTVVNGWYQNGAIFQSEYCAAAYSSSSSQCGVNKMSQWGSKYWADNGKTYTWILNYYYSPAPTYFTIIPQRPKTYISAATNNSITINFSSPGAAWYQVNKYANGTWNNIVYFGPGTSFTNTSLSSNQAYFYSVAAWNVGGWGPWSYNNGHLGGVAKFPSNPPPPITNPFFITNKEIRLKTDVFSSNIAWYYVVKWDGSRWVNVYYGSSNEYAAAILNPNSAYYYSVAVYDSILKRWSDYSNYNGYISVMTYPNY